MSRKMGQTEVQMFYQNLIVIFMEDNLIIYDVNTPGNAMEQIKWGTRWYP